LRCQRPFGFLDKNIVQNSFKAYCLKDGDLEVKGTCVKMCDLSEVFNSINKVSLSKTKLGNGGSIGSSKLVPINSIVNVVCADGHKLDDKSEKPNRGYQYHCGVPNQSIFKCIPEPLSFEKSPPQSNINEGFVTPLGCYAANINIPNGVISKKNQNVANYFTPTETLMIDCQPSYSATFGEASSQLGSKIVTSFTIECDKNGTGTWQNTQACIKRCDVSALVNASKTDINLVKFTGKNDLVKDKNDTSNTKIYADVGSSIDVVCAQGKEIRALGKNFYTTQCIYGSNFSVGSNAPTCENILTPCNNNEIEVTGDLQSTQELNGTTNVGQPLAFKCQGDGDNQKGLYFQKGNNGNNGSGGVPVCEYNETKQQSEWSHKTFRCFDGCISSDGKKDAPTSQIVLNITKSVQRTYVPAYYFAESISQKAVLNLGDAVGIHSFDSSYYDYNDISTTHPSVIKPGVNMLDWPLFKPLNKEFDIEQLFDTKTGVLKVPKDTKQRCTILSPLCKNNQNFGILYNQKMSAHICQSRQTELKIVDIDYKFVKFAYSGHDYHKKNYTRLTLAWIGNKNHGTKDCGEKSKHAHLHRGKGAVCEQNVQAKYGVGINQNKSSTITVDYKAWDLGVFHNNISLCNKALSAKDNDKYIFPTPNHDGCSGFGHYNVGDCNNYFTRAVINENVSCIVNRDVKTAKRWHMEYDKPDLGDSNRIKF
jgi:hypothetical protein